MSSSDENLIGLHLLEFWNSSTEKSHPILQSAQLITKISAELRILIVRLLTRKAVLANLASIDDFEQTNLLPQGLNRFCMVQQKV